MSTLASTKAFADNVKKEVKRIDVVFLNAGIFNKGFNVGKEGFEETIQVNVLSTALLGLSLLPWIKEVGGGKAHLAFVISVTHRNVDIDKWPQVKVLSYLSKAENVPKAGLM